MTGTVGIQLAHKLGVLASPSIKSVYASDPVFAAIDFVGMMVQEQIDMFFGGNDCLFFVVLKFFVPPR